MKKIHLLLLSLTICLFSACHNELWEAIDGLDSRVTKLEELCKEMNTNISALQTIVDVLQSNDFITSIVEIKKDGEIVGYTITFYKHDPITIYHGQDGKDGQNGADGKDGANGQDGSTPVIGVAQDSDGVYYWTLNGEWLLDDNGNKLTVSGKDGQDGEDGKDGADGQDGKDSITPQLKIEEGYWYISYDNGATWTQLGKATGEDGQDGKDGADGADGQDGQNGADGKDGQDGDSMFQSVTQDENYVYFTLADGTIIKIAKGNGLNDQPNENDIIEFKDLAVKSALLKLGVDTTKDNEISYGEAAAYKKELNFENNTAIYSFKEFQYFTGVTIIGDHDFRDCTNLFEIILPSNLLGIGNGAFSGCSSLTTINIPHNIAKINEYTFYGCSSLTHITIPNGVKTIGSYAFNKCSTLASIDMPNSVTEIGQYAFSDCPKLTSFTFPENYSITSSHIYTDANINTIYWNPINLENFYFSGYGDTYYGLGYSYLISYSSSGSHYHTNSSITQVIFGNDIQRIPNYLCEHLLGLTEITIPNSVTIIGNSAFYYCTSLNSVTIGENVTTIGDNAFRASSITSITFPKKVTSIGRYAFGECSNLKYCYSKAVTPPVLDSYAFPNTIGIIYVPRESVDEYKALWSDYASKIVGYDFE